MSGDIEALYSGALSDHARHPRNFREISGACVAEGRNPMCGDTIRVYADCAGGRLRDVAFQGAGCAVCTASASLMTEAAKGRSPAETRSLGEALRASLADDAGAQGAGAAPEAAGLLAALAAVRGFPSRVKCALLPWDTLAAALRGKG